MFFVPSRPSYRSALRSITFLILDVDGVLTDGRIIYTDDGREGKTFHVRDGFGIVDFRKRGHRVGIITGRSSPVVSRRAEELGIDVVMQGADDKLQSYAAIKEKYGLADREVAYIGDDVPDIAVLECVGFSAAPSDAHESVKRAVKYVCKHKGGRGAVREVVDMIIAAQSTRRQGRGR